jgi:peptidyl-prolyl cis-trans isomerase D
MIRFLQQKDNKLVKIIFGVIIGAVIVFMVVYLVPGLLDPTTGADPAVYATVRAPGAMARLFGETTPIKTEDVAKLAERQLQQQHYPASTIQAVMPLAMPQAAQALVQKAILEQAAHKLHLDASDEDIRRQLKDEYGQVFFPNGKFIGEDAYVSLLTGYGLSIKDFEDSVRTEIEIKRLEALVTGGATVSDAAVRAAYQTQATKVKFDYAVVSSDGIRKTINPSDADLQTYFKQNAARYALAFPETRKIEYVAFDAAKLPGGRPPVSDAEIQAYYAAHQTDYKTEEEVKTRHILISSKAGADAQTDTAAKAKAEDVLKQLQGGAKFADLAKKYSEDPGSKDAGGELPLMPTAQLDAAYAKAAMALAPGQTSGLVKSAFGYHIIQTEQKQAAGTKPLADVKDSIVQTLQQQKQGSAVAAYAQKLAAEAKSGGLDKMAAANGLHAVTTDYLAKDGVIGGLSDATALLAQAFATDKGAAPGTVSTGDGMAVFTVVDVKPAHAPEFAAYKDHILNDYRQEQVPRLLQQQTTKLADRAKALGDLKKAAAEIKATVKSSDLVGQDGQVPDLGAMSGPGTVAFTLPPGAISGPISAGQNGVVLSVTDKLAPSAADVVQHMDQTREQLLSDQRDEIFRVFLGTLSETYEKGGGVRYTKQPTPGLPGAPSGQ